MSELQLISREEARALGLKTFVVFKACIRNHVPCERYVSCNACVKCHEFRYGASRVETIQRTRIWALSNPEKVKSYGKKYRESNIEKCRKAISVWGQNYPERARAKLARRRAKRLEVSGQGWTEQDVKNLYEIQKGRCKYCFMLLGTAFHRDHRMPLALGGAHCKTNLQLLCVPCNLAKSDTHPDVWEAARIKKVLGF